MRRLPIRPFLSFWISTVALLPIVAQAQDATWLLNPGSGDWNTPGNWNPATVPTGTATFDTSNTTALSLSADTGINGITFNSTASAFSITASPTFVLTISGIGITNNSGVTQTFSVAGTGAGGSGAIEFQNSATAGSNVVINVNGAMLSGREGAGIFFENSSTAGSATINNNAGPVSGAGGGQTDFATNATAGSATINNNGAAVSNAQGGETFFEGGSTAASATINNNGATVSGNGSGSTVFDESATAGSATINNNAGTASAASGGTTYFDNSTTAANAVINNSGATVSGANGGEAQFNNSATAGSATINNNAGTTSFGGGFTQFNNSATAGGATINNNAGSVSGAGNGGTAFNGTSNAGTATINNNVGTGGAGSAITTFNDSSSAGSASINNNGATVDGIRGSLTAFGDSSTAGSAIINNNASPATGPFTSGGFAGGGGDTDFGSTSTAGSATLNNFGATVAGNGSGQTNFFETASAGSSTITNSAGIVSGAAGGLTQFNTSSTAGSAIISNNGGAATIAGSGETQFNDTSTAGSAAIINNGAVVSIAGGGETQFNGTSTAGSATIINNGAAVSIAGGGETIFNNSAMAGNATITNEGASVSGAGGGVTQFTITSSAGNATLIANAGSGSDGGGQIFFLDDASGGTARVEVFGNGLMDISQHNSPGMTVGSIEGDGNIFLGSFDLTVGSNNLSTTFSGVIQDGGTVGGTGGSLTKIGTGNLTLSGTNTFTGGMDIENGTLTVDSLFALGMGKVAVNGGTLRTLTGNEIFLVDTNYVQNGGGTLQIGLGRYSGLLSSDTLEANGTATLNGGTLSLVRENNYKPAKGDEFTILTAANGRTGQFASVEGPFNGLLQPIIIYDPNDVMVLFELTGSFISEAFTRNQRSVANELDEVSNDPRADNLIAFLGSEPLANLPHDYDLIAPEELASIYEIGFSQAVVQNMNLIHRMDDIRLGSTGYSGPVNEVPTGKDEAPVSDKNMVSKNEVPAFVPCPENRWGVFALGSGDFVDVGNDDNNARGYSLTTGSMLVGVDYRIGDHVAIGIDGEYANDIAELADKGRVYVDGGKAGAFATVYGKGWFGSKIYVDLAGGGGWNSYDTRRVGLQGEDVRGSTDGAEWNGMLTYGSDWTCGHLTFGTWSSLQYTDVQFNHFTEHGSLAPLEFPDQDEDSFRTTSGIRASYEMKFGNCGIFRPEVRAGWQHEYGDEAYPIDSRLASGAGDIFRVWGPTVGRDAALVDAGVTVQLNARFSTYVFYDGVLGRSNYQSNAVSGGFSVGF